MPFCLLEKVLETQINLFMETEAHHYENWLSDPQKRDLWKSSKRTGSWLYGPDRSCCVSPWPGLSRAACRWTLSVLSVPSRHSAALIHAPELGNHNPSFLDVSLKYR